MRVNQQKLFALLAWAIAITLMTTQIPMANAEDLNHDALCNQLSTAAEYVMEQRQKGAAMREMMSVLPDNDMYREMVNLAYDEPLYTTDEYIQRAITEFGNDTYQFCQEDLR